MSEHLLFLQAAGSNYHSAHELVTAVADVIQSARTEPVSQEASRAETVNSDSGNSSYSQRPSLHPERLADRIKHAGYEEKESLLLALSVLATTASPLSDADMNWMASVATRVSDKASLQEVAGVVFAFNTINRIADARRVRLEYRFLRQLKPLRGWIERRLASVTALAYDLSFKYQPRSSTTALLDRLSAQFERWGIPVVPDMFHWLGQSPAALEGVLEMIETNLLNSTVRPDLLKQAIAIAVASRAMCGSGLLKVVEHWLPSGLAGDSKALRDWAAPPGSNCHSDLVLAARRYCWQTANNAYTITDEQIGKLTALGLTDAEVLDITIATAVFSALAIIEPISLAGPVASVAQENLPPTRIKDVHVQTA